MSLKGGIIDDDRTRAVPNDLPGQEPWQSQEVDAPQPELVGPRRRGPLMVATLAVVGVVVLVGATAVVLYAVGPLIHDRQQRALLTEERAAIDDAATSNQGLYRPKLPTQPPAPGSVVGILAIPVLGLQQAVVEGASASDTMGAVGHVPGTAGLGQPGNDAVVGRRSGYGGPFGDLTQLHAGDHIVTVTTEGQNLYSVKSVRTVALVTPGTASVTTTTTTGAPTTTVPSKATSGRRSPSAKPGASTISTDAVFGPSAHDQLTLVTSAGGAPWNTSRAVVVVARMDGEPYAPTPQESRNTTEQGNDGDNSAVPWLLLALLLLLAFLAGAIVLYRRVSLRSAYLLTTAPLLFATVLFAEAATRLLPAWT